MTKGASDGANVIDIEDRGLAYRIRVLIRHPSQNLETITRESGLTPRMCAQRGDEHFAPNGAKLPGVHPCSVWTYWRDIHNSRNFSRSVTSLLDALTPAAGSINAVCASGGSADLILELAGGRNIGDNIGAGDLRRMAELGLDLGIEVYPEGI